MELFTTSPISLAATDNISAKADVDEYHRVALTVGGSDNGKPGIRTHYHAGYYAAFVKSPAGMNLEVVFHDMAARNVGVA
jgi:hypothetical protein